MKNQTLQLTVFATHAQSNILLSTKCRASHGAASLLMVAAAFFIFAIAPARAQSSLGSYHPLTLAPADTGNGGSGNAVDYNAQAAELAKKLANPTASLISVPFQHNWDFGIGPAKAMRYTMNFQPVVPFSISDDWNVVVRTIVPIIDAESPVKGGKNHFGLSDTLQSFFFSPKKPTGGGWIWGAGPVFLWPTATDDALGTEKFGAGPTAVLLKQKNGWTYGMLANHVWSFAGNDAKPEVNATYLLPFLSFTTKTHTTIQLNTESTYNWNDSQWTVPLNSNVSQLLKIGSQIISVGIGARYYAETPRYGPDWGMRFTVTFLFPKH
jgi:hypothetical protein